MKKIINKGIFKAIMLREAARNNAYKLKEKALETTGEGYVDVAIKIIIALVIGGLLLTGLIMLFNLVIMPRIETEVTSMFDAGGNTP